MKKIIFGFIALLILSVGVVLFFYKDNLQDIPILKNLIKETELKPLELSQEDISNITKPGIVSIYNHIVGELVVPYFDIDWDTLDLVFPKTKEEPFELEVDEYFRGSGFIVSPDGFIMTNAHVASDIAYKQSIAHQFIIYRLEQMLKSREEATRFMNTLEKKGVKEIDAEQFGAEMAIELINKLVPRLTLNATQEIFVLDALSAEGKLSDIIKNGFPAKLIDSNHNYLSDEKDVAILKIDKTNLPILDLKTTENISTGNKIYVYGFPSTGQFNNKSVLEPTFTPGTVSGLKTSKDSSFQVIQTDAKVSPGSSGGPLLNAYGEVIGLLTFASVSDSSGDTFAFAIPSSIAKDILDKNMMIGSNKWGDSMRAGIQYMQNNRCAKAIENFEIARSAVGNASINKNIDGYVASCKQMISSGQSIDTLAAEIKIKIKNFGGLFLLLIILGLILFITTFVVIFKLMRKIKVEEKQINELTHNSMLNGQLGQVTPTDNPMTSAVMPPLDINLVNYIKASRHAGLSNEAIITNLKGTGWNEADILRAINSIPK